MFFTHVSVIKRNFKKVTTMNSFEIRQKFLDYFARNGHTIVQSSSLIPAQDPTILFTNAGMNQFKDIFLGKEKRSYVRATSSQKCVRAGGKHNDLDQVGFTERHLTFFEMLGNFSFGDYFKKEAINYAWEFLTKDIGLNPNILYISVYKDDNEAYDLWHKTIGIPESRMVRLGEKDNFWQMGDTGPCGPCSEIYVDRGPDRGCKQPGCAPGCDCSRFTEIWNLVFMQYDRQTDGQLIPLKSPGVDTGMGLERLCMIVQNKDLIFNADMFEVLIKKIEELTGVSYEQAGQKANLEDTNRKAAFHVLADHVRSISLLIADGCSPSNDGRGYVLRKIIRRAALFTQKLTPNPKTFVKLAETFIASMSPVFPELTVNKTLILNILENEVDRFSQNLIQGQHILDKYIEENKKSGKTKLSGDQIFKLYDTYGFPPELTHLIAREKGFDTDPTGFQEAMLKQQEQSGKKSSDQSGQLVIPENITTTFVGYETLESTSKIIFVQQEQENIWIITQESPLYVECGGQVNDQATVTINNVTYTVVDLQKVGDMHNPAIAAKLAITGADKNISPVKVGDSAHILVNAQTRANTVKNHTATHLLQAALIQILGPQVKQAGSLVNDKYLRFDFSHHEALTPEQIVSIEDLVNQKIQEDIHTKIFNTSLDDAKNKGVIAFFGEKYNPENVRVVQIPGFSAELCGGTHATSTGIIGSFKITSDVALATGTRRLVAITGPEALKLFQQSFSTIKKLSEEFKAKQEDVLSSVQKLQQNYLEALSHIKQLKKQACKAQIPAWAQDIKNIGTTPFLYLETDDLNPDEMRMIAQELEKITPGFYVLINKDSQDKNKFGFFGYVSKKYETQVNLKNFSQFLKDAFQLRGGGSTTMIQGGGTLVPSNFKQEVMKWVEAQK